MAKYPKTIVGSTIKLATPKRFRYKLSVYQDQINEWRWRLFSLNGRIIAESGEGYKNKRHCVGMAHKLFPFLRRK